VVIVLLVLNQELIRSKAIIFAFDASAEAATFIAREMAMPLRIVYLFFIGAIKL
jgi:hypothetical protein